MSAKGESITTALDRWNAIFAWWGVPNASGNTQINGQMRRFQAFISDLQKAYGETYSNQMATLFSANERIARSLEEFLRCRQPQDVIAAELTVLATILEEASQQARTWIELTQKVQDCCAAMAREAADETRMQANEDTATKRPAKAA